jgi:hypothetical protein
MVFRISFEWGCALIESREPTTQNAEEMRQRHLVSLLLGFIVM